VNVRIALPVPAPFHAASIFGWAAAAILLGCVLALSGLPGLYAMIILASLIVFAAIALRFPSLTIGASIWGLALVPFSLGITTGILPKLFGDEALLLLYLVVFPALYLSQSRTWHPGFGSIYWVLALFVFALSLSMLAGSDLVAFRNFLETDVLGALLLVVFLQESANTKDPESIVDSVIWLIVLIAALSIIERVLQRNPLLEHNTTFAYISPELVRLTEGVYRPYVTFFHPSETGTFMALGVPFALRRWTQRRSFVSFAILAILAGGVAVNATRGVWVGIAVALLLLARRPLLIVISAIPILSVGAAVGYFIFRTTPFMQRLTDPNNFYSRLVYWMLALKVFAYHPAIGIGHMQFKNIYIAYVHDISNTAHFDISKIFAIDNMYLTTLVEHGLIGFIAFVATLIFLGVSLRKIRKRLVASHLPKIASLVRCSQLALVTYAVTGCFADVHEFTKATKFVFILVGLGLGIGARYLHASSPAAVTQDIPDSLSMEPCHE
jgi:O-antigen ligase